MSRPFAGRKVVIGWAAGLLLAAPAAVAQDVPASLPPTVTGETVIEVDPADQPIYDPEVTPAGCKSCGGGGMANVPPAKALGTWGTGDCGGPCYPGRRACDCTHYQPKTCIGRVLCGIYEAICCCDPCYEPQWLAVADSAFFTPAARPVTQQRIRWDTGRDYLFPDRAEYFWARIGGRGPANPERGINYRWISLYTEAAADAASAFIEVPYLRVDPENNPDRSGFGDLIVGTKALFCDCDTVQATFQFTTYIPAGQAGKGLGTGHTALEPALVYTLKLHENTYLQGMAAYWIPIGGDPEFQGDIFHYHFSLNHLLCCCGKDYKLVGSLEYVGYSVLDGSFTDPAVADPLPARTHMASAGGGLRLFICDKIDVGFGSMIFFTENRFTDELYRCELRWRF